MDMQTLSAEVRASRGKGSARQLRFAGQIPAVFYGPGVEPVSITISPKAFVKALESAYGRNVVFELELEGTKRKAMLKEIQVHPVTRDPLHVDFYAVSDDREVNVKVPFKTFGRALGVQKGGKLRVTVRELPVRCFPQNIPAEIKVDVAPLDSEAVFKVKDLTLPEGVTVTTRDEQRLILIQEDRRAAAKKDAEA